jgi:hypothetical protein
MDSGGDGLGVGLLAGAINGSIIAVTGIRRSSRPWA